MSEAPHGAGTVVIGVGNPLRRDDGAGPAVAAALLAAPAPPGWRVLAHHGEGLDLMDCWERHPGAAVVLVDATRGRAPAGTLSRFDAADGALPGERFHPASHLFGPAEAVELARALGRLPAPFVVYGIEGMDFGPGEGLSAPVGKAVRALAAALLASAAAAAPPRPGAAQEP